MNTIPKQKAVSALKPILQEFIEYLLDAYTIQVAMGKYERYKAFKELVVPV